jgi:hypothetical protein
MFGCFAVLLTLLVFLGFARTFYLHNLFSMPAPSSFLKVHGTLMSAWIVLLALQTALISAQRVSWHRRLGLAGAAVAVSIIPIGCMATVQAAKREVLAHSEYLVGQLNVLGLELTQVVLFAVLVSMALWRRNQPSTHKRLMVVATLCIVPNAIVRLAIISGSDFFQSNLHLLYLWTLLVAGVIAADTIRQRKIHPAFAWGGLAVVLGFYAAWYVSRTAAWDRYWIAVFS